MGSSAKFRFHCGGKARVVHMRESATTLYSHHHVAALVVRLEAPRREVARVDGRGRRALDVRLRREGLREREPGGEPLEQRLRIGAGLRWVVRSVGAEERRLAAIGEGEVGVASQRGASSTARSPVVVQGVVSAQQSERGRSIYRSNLAIAPENAPVPVGAVRGHPDAVEGWRRDGRVGARGAPQDVL